MTTTASMIVRGQNFAVRTDRRYVVVVVRSKPVHTDAGTYVAFAELERTTDNLDTAQSAASKADLGPGCVAVVVDLASGEEV